MRLPSLFPVYQKEAGTLEDGIVIKATTFCRERLGRNDAACLKHYQSLAQGMGFRMCPHGFTSLPVNFVGETMVLTGVIGAPRFSHSKEMERARQFPEARVARDAILSNAAFYRHAEDAVADMQAEARKQLPQALHELRKLNSIVKSNADKLSARDEQSQELKELAGAAELMSNIFEVVEALANVEGLRLIKRDEFIAAFDLAFKAKKIYQVRAKLRPIHIQLRGDDEVGILGSKKTFPIVLTVLLENAIKYGRRDSIIQMEVSREGLDCVLSVSNRTDVRIDPQKCFDRAVRFGDGSVEGSGLGLYLAREVVDSHGGSIQCVVEGDLVTMRVAVPAHSSRVSRNTKW